MKYAICSTFREGTPNRYFCAFHGFTPMFFGLAQARLFNTAQEATDFARAELFTSDTAFRLVEVST